MARRSINETDALLVALLFVVTGFGIKDCSDHKGIKETNAKTEIVKDVAILDSLDNRTKRIENVAKSNNDKLNTIKIDADSIKQATADLKDSTHVIIEQAKKCCGAKKTVAPKKEGAPVKPSEPVVAICGCDTIPVMQAPSAPVCDCEPVYYQPEATVAVVPDVPADNVVVVQNSEATVVINGNNNVVNVNQEPKTSVDPVEQAKAVANKCVVATDIMVIRCKARGRRR